MNEDVQFFMNEASTAKILNHLLACDSNFVASLNARVDLGEYVTKIYNNAVRFEAWSGESLAGLVAVYCNDRKNLAAFITSVSVVPKCQGKGIAAQLIGQSIEYAKKVGMYRVALEVESENHAAIALYEKYGFVVSVAGNPAIIMELFLCGEKIIEQ